MILITGASGNLGSSVIDQLLRHISKDDLLVSSSVASTVEALSAKGLHARLADFSDPNSLKDAFQGVTKLLLISTMDTNRLEQHRNVIDAAKAQAVTHIVYTSMAIQDIQSSAVKDLMISHFETEEYIVRSGMNYTILRNTMYAEALIQLLGTQGRFQDISLPAGLGKVPYALRREIAEATANLLCQDGHENAIYEMVGSTAYDLKEIAAAMETLTTDKINYTDSTEEEFRKNLKRSGLHEFLIYLHAGTILDIKNNQYDIQSKTLESLLGRPTAKAEDFLKEIFTS